MRILGIDPGTAITGFSIIEANKKKITLLDYGCIRTPSTDDMSNRLNQIAEDLITLIKKWRPHTASIEKIFFNKNVKTAISVAQARGVILQTLAKNGITQEEYTPLEIKSNVCGYGKADKKMVQKMVALTFSLEKPPQPDDAADAIAAAICLANHIKPES